MRDELLVTGLLAAVASGAVYEKAWREKREARRFFEDFLKVKREGIEKRAASYDYTTPPGYDYYGPISSTTGRPYTHGYDYNTYPPPAPAAYEGSGYDFEGSGYDNRDYTRPTPADPDYYGRDVTTPPPSYRTHAPVPSGRPYDERSYVTYPPTGPSGRPYYGSQYTTPPTPYRTHAPSPAPTGRPYHHGTYPPTGYPYYHSGSTSGYYRKKRDASYDFYDTTPGYDSYEYNTTPDYEPRSDYEITSTPDYEPRHDSYETRGPYEEPGYGSFEHGTTPEYDPRSDYEITSTPDYEPRHDSYETRGPYEEPGYGSFEHGTTPEYDPRSDYEVNTTPEYEPRHESYETRAPYEEPGYGSFERGTTPEYEPREYEMNTTPDYEPRHDSYETRAPYESSYEDNTTPEPPSFDYNTHETPSYDDYLRPSTGFPYYPEQLAESTISPSYDDYPQPSTGRPYYSEEQEKEVQEVISADTDDVYLAATTEEPEPFTYETPLPETESYLNDEPEAPAPAPFSGEIFSQEAFVEPEAPAAPHHRKISVGITLDIEKRSAEAKAESEEKKSEETRA